MSGGSGRSYFMAKKKNKTQSLAVGAIALFFGVLALCLGGFLAAVKVGGGDSTLTGFQAAFGYSVKTDVVISTIVTEVCTFNFMIMLALFLPVIGGVLAIFKGKLFGFLALVVFVVGAILMFLIPTLVKSTLVTAGISDWIGSVTGTDASVPTALGIGAIIGGVLSVLGALTAGYKTFFLK